MVEFQSFFEIDPSFKQLFSKKALDRLKGVSKAEAPQNHCLNIVKNKKFLKLLESAVEVGDFSSALLVFQEDLYESLSSEKIQYFEDRFAITASVKNVPLFLCKSSKLFYEQMKSTFNDMVDGRQMGTAEVHPTAQIAQGAFLGKGVVIEQDVIIHSGVKILSHSRIGAGTEIFPNTCIYQNVSIGKNCRIHAGTVIGSDGFGYEFNNGRHEKIWHFGGVTINDDVEIGSNCTIDQGTFSETFIDSGTKLDNDVHIAHNVSLGKGVILCAGSGVAGSTKMRDYVVVSGLVGIGPDLEIGPQTSVGGGAMVSTSWPEGKVELGGHPARPVKEWLRGVAHLRKISLPKKG